MGEENNEKNLQTEDGKWRIGNEIYEPFIHTQIIGVIEGSNISWLEHIEWRYKRNIVGKNKINQNQDLEKNVQDRKEWAEIVWLALVLQRP